MPSNDILSPIVWRDGKLCLLDQRLLPTEERWIECADLASVIEAIKEMVVRGAPAIGISAAYGAVIALSEVGSEAEGVARKKFTAMMDELAAARPTAVNLGWAVSEVKSLFALSASSSELNNCSVMALTPSKIMITPNKISTRRIRLDILWDGAGVMGCLPY